MSKPLKKDADFEFDLPEMQELISESEIAMLHTLMVYIAHDQKVQVQAVQERLEAEFDETPLTELQKSQFTQAVDFLEILSVSKTIH